MIIQPRYDKNRIVVDLGEPMDAGTDQTVCELSRSGANGSVQREESNQRSYFTRSSTA